ncbi:hypothetical protein Syn7502_02724 [Synechococcus sp. PCC 7502]|uniref:glycoside hydrolase family 10 protein n=1 Tax=Synechococcus sp. PCC 7502 TaxID=1173263 RepID=UPI00029F8EDE|nr:family 10 glycosylhydrolase [Synechococcus sp. PCC 7502]AFY74675.1 hypothetical protein Syn7502_02724 [Synechococcus sp. PCC 7502]
MRYLFTILMPLAIASLSIDSLAIQAQTNARAETKLSRNVQIDPDAARTESNIPVSNLTINTLEVIGMRQDLQELIGRIENSINTATASRTYQESALQKQAIANAKQFLENFNQMVQSGNSQAVRRQWQMVRQELLREYPTNTLSNLPEVRAIWVDRGTIVAAGSERKLAVIFDRMEAAGVNTVFLETINAGYPIYPSAIAPQQNPLVKGWDPLASAVKLAHERQMELHAWVWVFGVGNQRHNLLVNKPASYPGPVLERNPSWANLERNGRVFAPEGKTFLDPANPAVQNYLLSLYKEIITRYDVDGLQLDYIRYPRQEVGRDLGFGIAGRKEFEALTGIDPISISPNNPSLWWLWTSFKVQQIDNFVAKVSKELKQIKPRTIISAAVFPWKSLDRLNKIQQNWEAWASRGEVDLMVPMTYAPDTSAFLQQGVQPALAGISQAPALLLPGVLIKNLGNTELLDKLQALRDLPAGGYSLFAAEHLRPGFTDVLRYLQTSQGENIIPYREPFRAALSRYAALKEEWTLLVQSDRLWISKDDLIDWQKQVQVLDRALIELNLRPSRDRLNQAQTALENMSTNLGKWMNLENLERRYRVTTWSNRLDAIGAILRFGDRTAFSQGLPTAIKVVPDSAKTSPKSNVEVGTLVNQNK